MYLIRVTDGIYLWYLCHKNQHPSGCWFFIEDTGFEKADPHEAQRGIRFSLCVLRILRLRCASLRLAGGRVGDPPLQRKSYIVGEGY